MIAGVRGRLLSAAFVRDVLPSLAPHAARPAGIGRALTSWQRRAEAALGPASSARAVADVALVPLLELFGLTVVERTERAGGILLQLAAAEQRSLFALATPWGAPLDRTWAAAVAGTIGLDARWGLCCNGLALRLVDGRRTWSREYFEVDLTLLATDAEVQAVAWAVLHADAFSGAPSRLERAVDLSGRHGAAICRALGDGVLDALQTLVAALARSGDHRPQMLWEHSLVVVYRILFLLFSEARGLVPVWHPIYRDRYSITGIVATLLAGGPARGLWRAVQAISRLAHRGHASRALRVTAFNGRLFAPEHASLFGHASLDDDVMRRALVALSTAPAGRHPRARIVYRDLDVEQLGAVYERVLEYEPDAGARRLVHTRERRKASGTFYTPRAMTAYLVRQTLAPLVAERTADEILSLKVVDPAMGSGAFLVAACRYLAAAAEEALVREGRWTTHDVTAAERAGLRREVASRCLFGVDVNPMAVQLARLSLWLATLAVDKPLSFLDHHLVAGDSLVGATPADVARQPPGGRARRRPLPMFDDDGAGALAEAAEVMARIGRQADDSVDVVRAKERLLHDLRAAGSPLARWWDALDLWCSGWFQEDPPDRAVSLELIGSLLGQSSSLPRSAAAPWLEAARQVAAHHRFLHWTLQFPEVFAPAGGAPAGFDAVIGNPPWDMVRGDSGTAAARAERRSAARHLVAFARHAGVYRVESRAHTNLYHLFVERALQIVRPGGRLGLVVPGGLASDTGSAPLRRFLFDHAAVDSLASLDNRQAIFPVHRSVRFLLFTATAGSPTAAMRCRFGLSRVDDLERPAPPPLVLTRRLLTRLSGDDDLGVPEIASEGHLAAIEGIAARVPRLGDPDGWHVTFGRELNATDDRGLFEPIRPGAGARPIVEGRHVEPFRVATTASTLQLRDAPGRASRLPRRARLAYRDVASATNRLTLIAAIVPAHAVTTHTLFCLRGRVPEPAQRVLCALLNSYVANYLVRLRVHTHVTVSLVSRLPVPPVAPSAPAFARLRALHDALAGGHGPVEESDEYAEAQAIAARLYGLSTAELELVLATFPLVPEAVRARTLRRFARLM